jgi:hypothetical protein
MWVSHSVSPYTPQWLAVDLGQEQTINTSKVYSSGYGQPVNGTLQYYAPKRGRIEGSNYAAAWLRPERDAYWTPIASFEYPNSPRAELATSFAPVSYRYLRFVITEGWVPNNNVQITEWQLGFDPAVILNLSTGVSGNVFMLEQPVKVAAEIKVQATELSWHLLDGVSQQIVATDKLPCQGEKLELALPIAEPGYYELDVLLMDGEELLANSTLPLAVVRAQPYLDSPFASDGAISWLVAPEQFTPTASLMQKAGISWIRDRINWTEVESQRGVFKWGKYENSVNAQHSSGVKISMTFHDAPSWAKKPGHKLPEPEAMYHFAYEAGKHFAGRIQAWEIWNEADIGFSAAIDTPAHYAAVLKAAYLGFKAADPSIIVLTGGWTHLFKKFVNQVLRNDIQQYYDVFNFHNHVGKPSKFNVAVVDRYRKLLEDFKINKPMWLTEAGYAIPTNPEAIFSPADARDQARFLVQSFVESIAHGVDKHFYFVFPYYLEGINDWGILRKDLTVYPSYVALANLTDTLRIGQYVGRLAGTPDGAESFVFETGQGKVAVLWSEQELLWQAPRPLVVRNFMGQQQQESTLTIGPDPIFVFAVDDMLVPEQAEEKFSYPDPKRQSPLIPLLDCQLDYNKEQGGYASMGTEAFQVTLTLYNLGGKSYEGTAGLQLPDLWQVSPKVQDIVVKPGENAIYSFTVRPQAAIEEEIVIRSLVEVLGEPVSQSALMIFPSGRFAVEAPQRKEKVCIDGKLNEWQTYPASAAQATTFAPLDLEAKFWLAWDEEHLYLAATVQDDHFRQTQEPAGIWQEDSIQIGLDTNYDRASAFQEDDYELGFALGPDGPISYCWAGPTAGSPLAGVEVAIRRDEEQKTTNYEVAIPWQSIAPAQGQSGKVMGLSILINDSDGGQGREMLEWGGGIAAGKHPSSFNKLILK